MATNNSKIKHFIIEDKNHNELSYKLEEVFEENRYIQIIDISLRDVQPEGKFIQFCWTLPIYDIQYTWNPLSEMDKGLKGDWNHSVESKLSSSLPIVSFFNENEKNRYVCALTDVYNELKLNFGIHEEDGTLSCNVKIDLSQLNSKESYQIKIYHDFDELLFCQSIRNAVKWIREENNLDMMYPVKAAFNPVYSTWYSFHQDLNSDLLEEELRVAKDLGYQTVILDDGWQTDDNQRGYAYCGDWRIEKSKFPDFLSHVNRIKKLGMKYLVWFSVPFIGKYSKKWNEFKEKILYFDEEINAGVLDPRYPEVRMYLVNTYKTMVSEYGLDGLKLDFIDSFYCKNFVEVNEDMDILSLQEAIRELMLTIKNELSQLNSDLLIEFRQDYIGVGMQEFGNIFRVKDCPYNFVQNRVGIADLRLLCVNSSIHSDMLMWHQDECDEAVALQILNVIFSTPQISVKLTTLKESHRNILKFWLQFMNKYRKLLLLSDFTPHLPQFQYPWIEVQNEEQHLIAIYQNLLCVKLEKWKSEVLILNASYQNKVLVNYNGPIIDLKLEIYNKYGNMIKTFQTSWDKGVHCLEIPIGGFIKNVE